MRVVAGKYKGKNLMSPKDDSVRPTTTRIKETLFNMIQFDVKDAICLDLFSGSGAMGIECISRGAKKVTFVDKAKDSIELTKSNLKGIDGNYEVFMTDFLTFLNKARLHDEKYDLIFLDPPYATTFAEEAIEYILENGLLNEGGKILFEHAKEKTFVLDKKGYKQKTKVMGSVVCDFISTKSVGLMCGSYDPITKGHEALLDEALRHFDEVIVACLVNEEKEYMFDSKQREELVNLVCQDKKGAKAIFSNQMAIDVAKEVGAKYLIRGIRNEEDRKYENEMAKFNKDNGGIDTYFIELGYMEDISSTRVREEISKGIYKNVPAVCVEKIIEYRG